MRKKIVAGNWKMNKTLQEGIELAKEVNSKVKAANAKDVKVIIGTPFIHLAEVSKMVDPAELQNKDLASYCLQEQQAITDRYLIYSLIMLYIACIFLYIIRKYKRMIK